MVQADGPGATAIVAAADDETRVLLRGLLRLHHFRVLGETDGAAKALTLLKDHKPGLMVVDVNLSEGSAGDLLADARKLKADLRIVLVVPASRPSPLPEGAPRPDALLYRPFRIRQFLHAVSPEAGDPSVASVKTSSS